MNPEALSGILSNSRLGERACLTLLKKARSNLPQVQIAIDATLGTNPRFHFTPESFVFTPDNPRFQDRLIRAAVKKGWYVENLDEQGIAVETWHLLNIRYNGLRPNTYAACLPQDESLELTKLHPRFSINAFENIVRKFGKHCVPFKDPVFSPIPGTFSRIVGGVVIVNENVPAQCTGLHQRSCLKNSNLLQGREHLLTEGASPEHLIAAVTVSIDQKVRAQGSNFIIKGEVYYSDILSGLKTSIPVILKQKGDSPHSQKVTRLTKLFLTLSS